MHCVCLLQMCQLCVVFFSPKVALQNLFSIGMEMIDLPAIVTILKDRNMKLVLKLDLVYTHRARY